MAIYEKKVLLSIVLHFITALVCSIIIGYFGTNHCNLLSISRTTCFRSFNLSNPEIIGLACKDTNYLPVPFYQENMYYAYLPVMVHYPLCVIVVWMIRPYVRGTLEVMVFSQSTVEYLLSGSWYTVKDTVISGEIELSRCPRYKIDFGRCRKLCNWLHSLLRNFCWILIDIWSH